MTKKRTQTKSFTPPQPRSLRSRKRKCCDALEESAPSGEAVEAQPSHLEQDTEGTVLKTTSPPKDPHRPLTGCTTNPSQKANKAGDTTAPKQEGDPVEESLVVTGFEGEQAIGGAVEGAGTEETVPTNQDCEDTPQEDHSVESSVKDDEGREEEDIKTQRFLSSPPHPLTVAQPHPQLPSKEVKVGDGDSQTDNEEEQCGEKNQKPKMEERDSEQREAIDERGVCLGGGRKGPPVEEDGSVEAPEKKTAEEDRSVEAPEKKTAEEDISVEAPVKKTAEEDRSVEAPEKKTAEEARSVEAPEKKTAEEDISVEAPVKKTAVEDRSVEAPEKKTAEEDISVEAPVKKTEVEDRSVEAPEKKTAEEDRSVEAPVKKRRRRMGMCGLGERERERRRGIEEEQQKERKSVKEEGSVGEAMGMVRKGEEETVEKEREKDIGQSGDSGGGGGANLVAVEGTAAASSSDPSFLSFIPPSAPLGSTTEQRKKEKEGEKEEGEKEEEEKLEEEKLEKEKLDEEQLQSGGESSHAGPSEVAYSGPEQVTGEGLWTGLKVDPLGSEQPVVLGEEELDTEGVVEKKQEGDRGCCGSNEPEESPPRAPPPSSTTTPTSIPLEAGAEREHQGEVQSSPTQRERGAEDGAVAGAGAGAGTGANPRAFSLAPADRGESSTPPPTKPGPGREGHNQAAVTPGGSEENNHSASPDLTRDDDDAAVVDPFRALALDYVSDSQLNTITLTEEEEGEEDATELVCGLIRELSSLNRVVMATHRELETLRRGNKTARPPPCRGFPPRRSEI
ncbi:RNA-binding protein 25 isoform X2 [Coregonus clupeaformis]|uniref:RNA-binding protein 25 isoform X2 n=1 Tax=Coregonus clupeaformis TaxID=59861 RepID=UPI001E1C9AD9|nr:RNA-binding protein 25 isoform X2 [Coregonus clupeaformis]